ncbi:MAG: glycosyltransferase family 2 protein [Gemmatimonadaceae bacterium]
MIGPSVMSRLSSEPELELSVVMPCLNEADTLATCIDKAARAMAGEGISGEVVVADNGSTDGSQAIATSHGARVVAVGAKGYGNALMGGIAASRGRWVIMGDADDSYDFLELPKFVAKLRDGYDLVQGCRLPAGGGRVLPGAMPWLHRWIGNPLLSFLARRWFRGVTTDVYCGMRGFRRDLVERLEQRCTGMEFATEMIIKATLAKVKMAEVPITLHPDGREAHAPHLKTFRDGWRTLRLFLLFSPRWLFLLPGSLLLVLGIAGYAIALPSLQVGGVTFGAHTLLFSSLAMICGYQSVLFGISAKTFAIGQGMLPLDERMARLYRTIDLERAIVLSLLVMGAGVALLIVSVNHWRAVHFGALDYARTMRVAIPGVTLTAIGFQTLLSSFFASVLGMGRR